jgi:hypothetical protein
MGFWSIIGNAISSVAKKVYVVIKENLGDVMSSVATWIKENIFDLNEAPSYTPENATVDETKKINELIEKCIDGYSKESKECDQMTQKVVTERFKTIIELLDKVNEMSNPPIIDEYIFQIFQLKLKEINESLDNIYSKQIANVFSLNNNKLLNILKLDKGFEKKNKLNNLAKETIENANKELTRNLKGAVEKQQNFIMEKLNRYMEDRQNILEISKKETENIIDSLGKDKEDRQKLEAKYDNIIDKLDLLENLMRA